MPMFDERYFHLSGLLSGGRIGLGWLNCVTVHDTRVAVSTNWHSHRTVELLFGLRGETRYEFESAEPVTLSANMSLVIWRGVRHRVMQTIDAPSHRLGLHLLMRMDPRREFGLFSKTDYVRFMRALESRAGTPQLCSPSLVAMLKRLDCLARRDENQLLSEEWGLVRLLACGILYESVVMPTIRPTPQMRLMADAVTWLESHYTEKVAIPRLIAFMGYGRSRFFELFKQHTGLSPNDYLIRFRIRKAQELLTATDYSVQEVAASVGIPDLCYFSALFKCQTGYAPSHFRARFQAKGVGSRKK